MNYLFLIFAGILSGGIVFGGKILALLGATPFEVMFYPNFIGALLALPFSWKSFNTIVSFPLAANLIFIVAVFAIAVGQYVPLFMNVSVTLVLLLLYLQPVWTILIEHFYFRRPVPPRNWFLVTAMVAGLILLINPFAGEIKFSWLGITLALAAGIGMSLWILVTQYFSRHNIKPAATYFCTCLYAAVPVFFLWLAARDYLMAAPDAVSILGLDPTRHLWAALLLYSIFIYTPANTLVFYGNKNISPAVVGMILLLEPVTGITLDILFLHTPLTWNIIAGGAVILLSNLTLILKK